MKINIYETTDIQLNFLVAKCLAIQTGKSYVNTPNGKLFINSPTNPLSPLKSFNPSTNWKQGGEILDYLIKDSWKLSEVDFGIVGMKLCRIGDCDYIGDTILIVTMRCFVGSILGDDIELPDDLLK